MKMAAAAGSGGSNDKLESGSCDAVVGWRVHVMTLKMSIVGSTGTASAEAEAPAASKALQLDLLHTCNCVASCCCMLATAAKCSLVVFGQRVCC
jgi:hypothetical protein